MGCECEVSRSSDDPRALLTRDYPALEVPWRSASTEVRAGEGVNTGIRGWILVFGYLGGASAPEQYLVGRLDLRYPLPANVSHLIDGFDAATGGAVFLPWPYAGFAIEDRAGEEVPSSVTYSRAAVSFVPVLADDPAPPGLSSVLYGRDRVAVHSEDTEVEVPWGATEYRILPAATFPGRGRLSVQEKTGSRIWARYTIDPNQPMASNAALGAAAWKQTPPREQARICLSHNTTGERYVTVYWRFDLGMIR